MALMICLARPRRLGTWRLKKSILLQNMSWLCASGDHRTDPDQKWFMIALRDSTESFMLDLMPCVRVSVMDLTMTLAALWHHVEIDQIRPTKDAISFAGTAL